MPADCHCLCTVNHPDEPNICVGTDDVRISHDLLGERVDVPFCYPCAAAKLAHDEEAS